MDPGVRLRREFEAHQKTAMTHTALYQLRRRVAGGFAGGLAGVAAVALSATITSDQILWHSFVLEGVLCAAAGWMLVRFGGGILKGALFFSLAYLAAYQFRASGLDPGALFAPGNLHFAVAGQGHLLALGMLIAMGGAIGLSAES